VGEITSDPTQPVKAREPTRSALALFIYPMGGRDHASLMPLQCMGQKATGRFASGGNTSQLQSSPLNPHPWESRMGFKGDPETHEDQLSTKCQEIIRQLGKYRDTSTMTTHMKRSTYEHHRERRRITATPPAFRNRAPTCDSRRAWHFP